MEFSHYENVPIHVAQELIAASTQDGDED